MNEIHDIGCNVMSYSSETYNHMVDRSRVFETMPNYPIRPVSNRTRLELGRFGYKNWFCSQIDRMCAEPGGLT